MSRASLWIVGQVDELLQPTEAGVGEVDISFQVDLDAAQRALVDGERPPEVILLAQSRPGERATDAVAALGRLAPLARVWRLLGSWCEGEARSGNPPPGCTSIYWHQWPARWAQEQAAIAAGHAPSWTLPVTASAEERTAAAAEVVPARGSGLIVIASGSAAAAGALEDACRFAGYDTLVVAAHDNWRVSEAAAVLWDTSPECLAVAESIRRLRALAGEAPLVAMAGFVRAEDVQAALAAGACAVVSKPWNLHELMRVLAGAIQ